MGRAHPFLPTSPSSEELKILKALGLTDIDQLFGDIPENIRLKQPLKIPKGMSELEVRRHVESVLAVNRSAHDMPIFLGGGVWHHFVPAAVDTIIGRGEFLTSYTPYQAEMSQGILQAMFEYQSMICEITGMEYANSSLYDWSTALGEAARMAVRVTHRDEILIPHFIHPERLSTLKSYSEPVDVKIREYEQSPQKGQADVEALEGKLSGRTAAVYVEYPSYLGFLEEGLQQIVEAAHRKGALTIVGVDPIALGVLKPPGEFGVDIVVGEGQALGNHVNFGGPLLGILACSGDKLLRQLPGRLVGMTTTRDGRQRAFSMALMTREQHIRREKATSNVCTNEALLAVAAAVYLSLLGPQGLRELGLTILNKANYAMRRLSEIRGVKAPLFDAPHFKEFTVSVDGAKARMENVHRKLLSSGVHGGKLLMQEFPELGETALYCVTENHSERDIDHLAFAFEQALR